VRQPKKGTRCARVISFLDENFFFGGGGGAYALCAANGTAPFPTAKRCGVRFDGFYQAAQLEGVIRWAIIHSILLMAHPTW
jgi:hypothetical protein